MDVDNACLYLNAVDCAGARGLFHQLLTYILNNGEKCLKSISFCEMSSENVQRVIEADDLKARELSVWEALVRWSEAECKRRGEPSTDGNIRQVMGDLVYCVRFRGISSEECAHTVAARRILTAEETVGIFRFCNGAVQFCEKFTTKSGRSSTAADASNKRCIRFPKARIVSGVHGEHSISFSVSAPVVLCGVMLLRCNKSRCQYRLQLINMDSDILLSENKTEDTDLDNTVPDTTTFDVMLRREIALQSNVPYTLYVTINVDSGYFGCEGRGSVTTDGVTFNFTNNNKKGNNTTVDQGQISGFIFRRDV